MFNEYICTCTILQVKQPRYVWTMHIYIISLRATEVVARQGKRGTSDPWMGSANAPVISKRIRLGFRDTCLKGTINDVFSALI